MFSPDFPTFTGRDLQGFFNSQFSLIPVFPVPQHLIILVT